MVRGITETLASNGISDQDIDYLVDKMDKHTMMLINANLPGWRRSENASNRYKQLLTDLNQLKRHLIDGIQIPSYEYDMRMNPID